MSAFGPKSDMATYPRSNRLAKVRLVEPHLLDCYRLA
jgi:hypothetical protein